MTNQHIVPLISNKWRLGLKCSRVFKKHFNSLRTDATEGTYRKSKRSVDRVSRDAMQLKKEVLILESALIYDSVHMFAAAFAQLSHAQHIKV